MTLLPPNVSAFERALEQVTVRIDQVPVPLRQLWSATDCPLPLLPWLAWSLSIDNWDDGWSEPIKRARVAAAIEIQRSKGTVASIRKIVQVFGGAVSLREWWQTDPPGQRHTFDLVLTLGSGDAPPTATFVEQVIDEIERTKPVRSRFSFSLSTDFAGAIGVVAVCRPVFYTRLVFDAPAA